MGEAEREVSAADDRVGRRGKKLEYITITGVASAGGTCGRVCFILTSLRGNWKYSGRISAFVWRAKSVALHLLSESNPVGMKFSLKSPPAKSP